MDGIPVHWELTLLLVIVRAKSSYDFLIPQKLLGAPESNTEGHACGLNSKVAADMREHKAATAEDTFDVNS